MLLQSVACVPIQGAQRRGDQAPSTPWRPGLRPAQSFSDELGTLSCARADQVAIAIETARLVRRERPPRRPELSVARSTELEAARAKLEELRCSATAPPSSRRRAAILRSARAVLRGHLRLRGPGRHQRGHALSGATRSSTGSRTPTCPILITGERQPARRWWPAPASTTAAAPGREEAPLLEASTAAPSPSTSWRASSSATCAGRLHHGADRDRKGSSSATPPRAPSSSTRSGRCRRRCRPACSACCRRRWCARSAALARSRSTRASSPPPTAISRSMVGRRGVFPRGSLLPPPRHPRSASPRSAWSTWRTCRCSSTTSSASSPPATTASAAASPARPSKRPRRLLSWPGNVPPAPRTSSSTPWVLSDRPELEAEDFELPAGRPLARPAPPPEAPAPAEPETSLDAHKVPASASASSPPSAAAN